MMAEFNTAGIVKCSSLIFLCAKACYNIYMSCLLLNTVEFLFIYFEPGNEKTGFKEHADIKQDVGQLAHVCSLISMLTKYDTL